MVQLVEALGWSFGLPDEPADGDYRKILEGRRTFRIEAETHYHPDDQVSVQQFHSFGPFSGDGWLSGISSPTVARLHFNLPLGGDFAVTVALRLPGHKIRIAGQLVEVDGADRFEPHAIGNFTVAAGEYDVEIHLPPNGAIDYVELTAADLPPVQPVAGWQPEEALTVATMAETAAQVLALNSLLPSAGKPTVIEAEASGQAPAGTTVTPASHLGEPSGGAWIRAGATAALLPLSFDRPQAGLHLLKVRAAAESPITATINGGLSQAVATLPYLESMPIGSYILPAGRNTIDLDIPPRGGVDSLLLFPAAEPDAFLRLAGLPANADPPEAALVESYLALLAAIGGTR